jgi:hypothetical protein
MTDLLSFRTLGSASVPIICNSTSTNTGIYYPTSTSVGISISGSNVVTVNSTGVGIGTTNPKANLSFVSNVYTAPLGGSAYSQYQIILYDGGTAATSYGMGIESYNMGFNSSGGYKFYQTGGTTPLMVIGGQSTTGVGIGVSAPFCAFSTYTPTISMPNATAWDNTWTVIGANGVNAHGVGIGISTNSYAVINSLSPTAGWRNLAFQTGGGSVAIGTTTFSYQFTLSTDSAAKPSTNLWTVNSDSRIKTNIVDASTSEALALINGLRIREFGYDHTYAACSKLDPTYTEKYGLIAQELQEVAPYCVSTVAGDTVFKDPNSNLPDLTVSDILGINCDELNYATYGAVQELSKQLNLILARLTAANIP